MRFFTQLSFLAVFSLWSQLAWSAPAVGGDINGDGSSDFTLITIESNSSLTWKSYNADGTQFDEQLSFGANGANIALANWQSTSQATLAFISVPSGSTDAYWTHISASDVQSQRKFGSSTSFKFISGADFNGNGYADAAVIRSEVSGNLIWDVRPDFFASGSSRSNARRKESQDAKRHRALARTGRVTLRFGKSTDSPFFFDPAGRGAVLAVLRQEASGSYSIYTRHPYTGKIRKINLGNLTSPLTPLPLQQNSGGDLLAIVSRGTSTTAVGFYSAKGALLGQGTLSGTGTLVVGKFSGASGQGIAIQSGSNFEILHPSSPSTSSNVTVASGIAVDDINITSFLPDSDDSSGGPLPTCDMPSSAPPSSLASVCTSLHPMNRCVLYKPGSGGTADDRTGKPVFLWYEEVNNPNVGQLKVLASNGAQVGTFGFYYPAPAPLARFYSGYAGGSGYTGTQLMERATAASASPWLYFLTSDGNCWGPVKNANGRSGGR